jgi:hypothetical protein
VCLNAKALPTAEHETFILTLPPLHYNVGIPRYIGFLNGRDRQEVPLCKERQSFSTAIREVEHFLIPQINSELADYCSAELTYGPYVIVALQLLQVSLR